MKKDNSNIGQLSKYLLYFVFNMLIFLVISTNQAQTAVTLKFVLTYPVNHPWSIASIKFANEVEKRSKGNINIKVFPPGTLLPPSKVIEALKAGEIEMANSSTDLMSRYVKPMKIFNLPFLFRDLEQAEDFLNSRIGEKLLAEGKAEGVIGISYFPSEFPVIVSTDKPIKQLADLKGLKIFTVPHLEQYSTYEALGAIPMTLPGNKYAALLRDTVDAAEFSPYSLYETEPSWDYKYMTGLPIAYIPGLLAMNYDKWKSLSSELKKAIFDCIPLARKTAWEALKSQKKAFVQAALKKGITIEHIKEVEPFKTATKPIFKKALYQLPKLYRDVAYKISYKTFNLRVISSPRGADVYYGRQRASNRYKDCTTCVIPKLFYATWKIKVSLDGKSDEREFDALREPGEKEKVIVFDLAN